MDDVPPALRREAAILARRKSARRVEFSEDAPTRWNPHLVTDPSSGEPFTPNAAWEFLADMLENPNQSAEWIELNHPPGKRAIVMKIEVLGKTIYTKFQLGAGQIQARSFHYSDKT